MLFKKLLIILLSILFTILNADTLEIRPNKISTNQNIQTNKAAELKTGIAVDIKVDEDSKIHYTIAYEGDYMIVNDYLDEENQIEDNNFYIGIGYKF